MLIDVQYPTPWLLVLLLAAAIAGPLLIRAWSRRVRVLVAVVLVALVLVGWAVLPQLLDVDRLFSPG